MLKRWCTWWVLLTSACALPDAPGSRWVDAAARDTPEAAALSPPRSYEYVFTTISIDQGPGGMAPVPTMHAQGVTGFNLDGRFSGPAGSMQADCAHGDFFSVTDPDQNMGTCVAGMARGGSRCVGGVDNQLPELATIFAGFGSDVRMDTANQFTQGRITILLRVSEVNGTPGPGFYDDDVRVSVFTTGRPLFNECARLLSAGQSYAIDTSSGEATFSGRILNGRLVVTPPTDPTSVNFIVALQAGSTRLPLRLIQTRLRFDMTPDAGVAGNLGGYVPLDDLVTLFQSLLGAGVPVSTVRTVAASVVDLQYPAGSASGCLDPNGAVSIGFGFTLFRATIAPARVSGPQPGMCGS